MAVNFSLEGLDANITAALASMESLAEIDMPRHCDAVVFVGTNVMRECFKFTADSLDIEDLNAGAGPFGADNDIQFVIDGQKFCNSVCGHLAEYTVKAHGGAAEATKPTTYGLDHAGVARLEAKSKLKHDYPRDLAAKLYDASTLADFFNNENAVRRSIVSQCRALCLTNGSIFDTLLAADGMTTAADGDTTSANIGRVMLQLIANQAPARFADMDPERTTNAAHNEYYTPFVDGDIITFLLTVNPAANQGVSINGGAEPSSRTYRMIIKLVADATLDGGLGNGAPATGYNLLYGNAAAPILSMELDYADNTPTANALHFGSNAGTSVCKLGDITANVALDIETHNIAVLQGQNLAPAGEVNDAAGAAESTVGGGGGGGGGAQSLDLTAGQEIAIAENTFIANGNGLQISQMIWSQPKLINAHAGQTLMVRTVQADTTAKPAANDPYAVQDGNGVWWTMVQSNGVNLGTIADMEVHIVDTGATGAQSGNMGLEMFSSTAVNATATPQQDGTVLISDGALVVAGWPHFTSGGPQILYVRSA